MSDSSLGVFALIEYFDTSSVVLAILKMNGVVVKGRHIHLDFGKSQPSNCVWISGFKQSRDDNFLLSYLADCGLIISYSIDQINKRALVYFKEVKFNLNISMLFFVYVWYLGGCHYTLKVYVRTVSLKKKTT